MHEGGAVASVAISADGTAVSLGTVHLQGLPPLSADPTTTSTGFHVQVEGLPAEPMAPSAAFSGSLVVFTPTRDFPGTSFGEPWAAATRDRMCGR